MGRILAIGLAAMTMSAKAMGCDGVPPGHLRVFDCRLAAAVASAADRSAMLKDLLERVERADGLVFIMNPPLVGPATRLLGGLSHTVTTAGRYRVLRSFIPATTNERTIATVGHELTHALEVLEMSPARTEAEVDALFERIGWRTAARVVETQAALDAGDAIARELSARRPMGG